MKEVTNKKPKLRLTKLSKRGLLSSLFKVDDIVNYSDELQIKIGDTIEGSELDNLIKSYKVNIIRIEAEKLPYEK